MTQQCFMGFKYLQHFQAKLGCTPNEYRRLNWFIPIHINNTSIIRYIFFTTKGTRCTQWHLVKLSVLSDLFKIVLIPTHINNTRIFSIWNGIKPLFYDIVLLKLMIKFLGFKKLGLSSHKYSIIHQCSFELPMFKFSTSTPIS